MNGLKLNNIKNEFLHGSNSRHRLTNPISTLNVDGTLVHAAKYVEIFGSPLMISSPLNIVYHKNVALHHLGCTKL